MIDLLATVIKAHDKGMKVSWQFREIQTPAVAALRQRQDYTQSKAMTNGLG